MDSCSLGAQLNSSSPFCIWVAARKIRKQNGLDGCVGPAFGTIEKIRCAKVNELYAVKGINKSLAEQIYGFFNSQ